MLIAFEGIDGAGKTTTASLLVARLSELGCVAREFQKREPEVCSTFARSQLRALADRLWGVPHDGTLASLGSLHWIYLNAAYFTGVWEALSAEIDPHEVVVVDNWINKFIARVSTNSEFTLDEVLAILRPVPQPELVFLLDVPPSTAAARKAAPTELERGPLLAGERDFVSYQVTVREMLLSMADRFGWTVVTPGDRTAETLAWEMANLVKARLTDC